MIKFFNPQKLVIFIVFCLFSINIYSANRYWVANAASNWNNTANWSTVNGGLGGASVPVAGDFVYFNNNGLGNCTLDVNAGFDGININVAYTGILELAGFAFNPSISNGASVCTFGGGTINDTPATSSVSFTTTTNVYFSGTL